MCLPPGTPAKKQVLAFVACEQLRTHLPEHTSQEVGEETGRLPCKKKKNKMHVFYYKQIAWLERNSIDIHGVQNGIIF